LAVSILLGQRQGNAGRDIPGITRELVGQEFPLVISAEVTIPDQSKIMRAYNDGS